MEYLMEYFIVFFLGICIGIMIGADGCKIDREELRQLRDKNDL